MQPPYCTHQNAVCSVMHPNVTYLIESEDVVNAVTFPVVALIVHVCYVKFSSLSLEKFCNQVLSLNSSLYNYYALTFVLRC